MKPEPSPATPDLKALVCLIGGAVREAGALNLLMQLLLVSGYCPPLRMAVLMWISVEERYASSETEYELFAEEDGEGGADEFRPGWMSREGPVQFWRHVTRFGLALLIPVQLFWSRPRADFVVLVRNLWRMRVLSGLSHFKIFLSGLAAGKNYVLFVPVS